MVDKRSIWYECVEQERFLFSRIILSRSTQRDFFFFLISTLITNEYSSEDFETREYTRDSRCVVNLPGIIYVGAMYGVTGVVWPRRICIQRAN